VAIGLLLALGWSGCKKASESENVTEATSAPTPVPPPAPEATPVAVVTPAPVATPAPQLAPPGDYYLVSAVSVETSDGIVGLKPGQLLQEIRPGVYKADGNEVSLRPEQVTNDLAMARRVAVQDQMNQSAIRQRMAAQAPAPSPVPQPAGPRTNAVGPGAPPVDATAAARKELFQQRDENNQAVNRLVVELGQASAHWGGNWDYAAKKSPQVFQLLQQYNGLQRQRAEIDAKIAALP
jgi:hypothetical protein